MGCRRRFEQIGYANHLIPRSFVTEVFADVRDLVHQMMLLMKRKIRSGISHSDTCFEKVESILDSFREPFNTLSREYRCFKVFEETGHLVPLESYDVVACTDDVLKEKRIIKEIISVKAEFISMRDTSKNIFSSPGILSTVLDYMQKLQHNDEYLGNFVQGRQWKQKIKNHFQQKTVISLFLYFDELKICNSIGSHAGIHKLGAVYHQVACFPPQANSFSENIFLCGLFYSQN